MRTRVAASIAVVLSIVLGVGFSAVSGLGRTSDFGILVGAVTDEAGATLPGVTITVSGPERRSALTNERGEFRFAGLLPGTYETRAELAGFHVSVTKVTVVAGRTERITVRMESSRNL
jgi:protocatechuate 3,4-dioxygenase beta subunit